MRHYFFDTSYSTLDIFFHKANESTLSEFIFTLSKINMPTEKVYHREYKLGKKTSSNCLFYAIHFWSKQYKRVLFLKQIYNKRVLINFKVKYRIFCNKRRASNKRRPLLSTAPLGIHIEIRASL